MDTGNFQIQLKAIFNYSGGKPGPIRLDLFGSRLKRKALKFKDAFSCFYRKLPSIVQFKFEMRFECERGRLRMLRLRFLVFMDNYLLQYSSNLKCVSDVDA